MWGSLTDASTQVLKNLQDDHYSLLDTPLMVAVTDKHPIAKLFDMEEETYESIMEKLSELDTPVKSRPKVVLTGDTELMTKLISIAKSYMDAAESRDEEDTERAYEFIMESVYGEDVWDYINNL